MKHRVINFVLGAGSYSVGYLIHGYWFGVATGGTFLVGFAYGAWRGIGLAA